MKGILITLAVAVVLAVAGFGAWRFVNLPPISQKEMDDLQKKGVVEDKEVVRLLACFEHNDEDLRVKAAETLSQMGPKAVEPVRARLKHKDPSVRFWAVQTLAFLGPEAAGATDDLLGLLQDSDARVRYKTVYTLGRLGVKNDKVFQGMVTALKDEDADVRDTAVETVKDMGAPPAEVVPALALAVKEVLPAYRGAVLLLLGKAGEPALPTFKELLKKSNPTADDFPVLIHATAMLGPHVPTLLPELNLVLGTQLRGSQISPELINLFKQCGPQGAKSLADALQDVETDRIVHNHRLVLLKGIGALGPDAKVAVPILVELLQNKAKLPVNYRGAILETLGDIGGAAAREAAPAVEALTQEPAIAEEARAALRRMGVAAKK